MLASRFRQNESDWRVSFSSSNCQLFIPKASRAKSGLRAVSTNLVTLVKKYLTNSYQPGNLWRKSIRAATHLSNEVASAHGRKMGGMVLVGMIENDRVRPLSSVGRIDSVALPMEKPSKTLQPVPFRSCDSPTIVDKGASRRVTKGKIKLYCSTRGSNWGRQASCATRGSFGCPRLYV